MYCIPRKFGKRCVGQMGRTTETRCKGHIRHTHLGHQEKSVMVEDRLETGYYINLSSTSIVGKATGYMDSLIKEVVEMRLHPRNFDPGTLWLVWSSNTEIHQSREKVKPNKKWFLFIITSNSDDGDISGPWNIWHSWWLGKILLTLATESLGLTWGSVNRT